MKEDLTGGPSSLTPLSAVGSARLNRLASSRILVRRRGPSRARETGTPSLKNAPSRGAEEGFGMERTARTRRRGSRAVLAVLLAAVAVAIVSALALAVPQQAQAATAAEKLQELRVRRAGTMEGYSRDLFPHWSDAREYGWKLPAGTPDPGSCDARDAALIRDGREEAVGSGCVVGSGRWFDPYTGTTYTQPSDIDVDHVVRSPTPGGAGPPRGPPRRRNASPTSLVTSSPSRTTPTRRRATRAPRPGSRRGPPTTAPTPRSGSA